MNTTSQEFKLKTNYSMTKKIFLLCFLATTIIISSNTVPLPSSYKLTGPSFAEISIVPVCYSDDGVILCRTKYIVNSMGAHRMEDHDFGYLLVSANGIWKEIDHIHIETETISYDSLDKIEKIHNEPIDLEKPPKHLDSIIKKYDMIRTVDYPVRRNQYFWTTKGIYNNKDIIESNSTEQKTLNGIVNEKGTGTRTGCAYSIMGVVFFENYCHSDFYDETTLVSGATFLQNNFDFPIDYYDVTGICIIKPH